MGLFAAFKANVSAKKQFKSWEKAQSRLLKMNIGELCALDDQSLFDAAVARTQKKVDSFAELSDGINSLNGMQKTFYCVNYLEEEVNNGGLCQFFANSSRIAAPYVSEYMADIDAKEHKNLYDAFIKKYGIDLSDLSSFEVEDIEKYEEQTKRLPFDEYDDAFFEIVPLTEYLIKYVKTDIPEFFRGI